MGSLLLSKVHWAIIDYKSFKCSIPVVSNSKGFEDLFI